MASSSTSSIPTTTNFMYDVFLSFRGVDTRKNFVDHLYHALVQGNIVTFKDDKNMEKGERISTELIKAIEDSRFHIIVFSKNYASSSWCLDELVKIMECRKVTEQKAYPIFYDVEPSEVRKQSGAFGEAFAKHRNEVDAGKWRKALEEAAGLIGWELKNIADGHEFPFIQMVVEEISQKLPSVDSSVDENLVGMVTRIDDIVSSLETSVDDVRMLGIKGMGGGGKTTLAAAIFDQISFQFESKSFVENVREVSKPDFSGLKGLQKQVLSDVLNNQGISVTGVHDGKNKMKKMMHGRKVLLVLDDVDHIGQLEALAGELTWFKSGSRIIITTRDEQVLIAHGVKLIHDVNLLSDEEAICLFNRFAFRGEIPNPRYKELSQQVVHYAAGLPLTIKVLGSDLKGKGEHEWKDTLESLKTIPLEETLQKLELSYMGLNRDHRDIFLDVACFWKDRPIDYAIRVLESCKLHAISGLSVLQRKSLIRVSKYGSLQMHDSIQEMGRDIVRREHRDEPHKHSRLWINEEIENILLNDLGTEATRCIRLRVKFNQNIIMKGLRKMTNLRFLHLFFLTDDAQTDDDSDVINIDDAQTDDDSEPDTSCEVDEVDEVDEVSQYFPDALQHLLWKRYPFRCLPNAFRAKNLAGLEMPFYGGIQLWESGDREVLNKLKYLVLDASMLRTLDLGVTPNLETLSLIECYDFEELHIPHKHPKLKSLHLTCSYYLKSLDLRQTPNLEVLCLKECDDLEELHMPNECPTLKSVDLSCSNLKRLNLGLTPNLETLTFKGCNNLVEISIRRPKIKSLELKPSKSETLDLRQTENLETLNIGGCDNLVKLYMPIKCLTLKSLHLRCAKLMTVDLEGPRNLETLSLIGCDDLVELCMPAICPKLKSLYLSSSKLTTLGLGLTPNLETLSFKECDHLVELHFLNKCLKLEFLDITRSKLRTLDLRGTSNLKRLSLVYCDDLLELHMPVEFPKLENFEIIGSKLRTLDFRGTLNLKTLRLGNCVDLLALHMPVEFPKLEFLDITGSKLRTLDLRGASNLKRLSLVYCDDLLELHMPVEFPKLENFEIVGSKLRTLDFRGTLNLKESSLVNCDDLLELHMPVEFPKLETLYIFGSKLRTLDFRGTLNLKRLSLVNCVDLLELHMPVEFLKLESLQICGTKLRTLDLRQTSNLDTSSLEVMVDLVKLDINIRGSKLRTLDLNDFWNLETLSLRGCYDLGDLNVVGGDYKLRSLNLSDSSLRFITFLFEKIRMSPDIRIPWMSNNLRQFRCLEELTLLSLEIKYLPNDIWVLKHLKSLKIESCLLETITEDLVQLEYLEELILTECKFLRDIPSNICKMKRLRYINLRNCFLVEKLPEELGHLECLEELNIEGTGISKLPHSITVLKFRLIFGPRLLRIVGSRSLLQSCGFTSEIQTSEEETFCYIQSWLNLGWI